MYGPLNRQSGVMYRAVGFGFVSIICSVNDELSVNFYAERFGEPYTNVLMTAEELETFIVS